MTITDIVEVHNDNIPKTAPVKEVMNIKIPDLIEGIPNRNGFIWVLCGSGGSGKTSQLLNFFKKKELYRSKFDNVFYIAPMGSFLSVQNHPFKDHDKVYHELTTGLLEDIYEQLLQIKEAREGDDPIQYSCVIIDDMADTLKEKGVQKMLNKMLIKARHLCCAFIFTLQSYYYYPKILRKQITNLTLFKPKNRAEWDSITKELLMMNEEDGLKIYEYIFNEPYAHLDLDTIDNKIYKNFNELQIKN